MSAIARLLQRPYPEFMPRLARFKIAAIAELLRQLEYAPPETRQRQMEAAERLVRDLDLQRNYPEEFVIFRITGYRPDHGGESAMLVGQALMADLVNLVRALSGALQLSPSHLGRTALSLVEAADRLRVSAKTLQRYRKQGLVCHVVKDEGQRRPRLACFEDALEHFVRHHQRQVNHAGGFTRIDQDAQAQIVQRARELAHAQPGMSVSEAAARLAETFGRAHETLRLLLLRHDRTSSQPIFLQRGPLTGREVREIFDAWDQGAEPAELARRFGKTRSTIHRAINRRRRDRLRSLALSHLELPTFTLPEAAEVILNAPAARSGWEVRGLERFDASASPLQTDDAAEAALAAAYNFLKGRAGRGIAALGEWPAAAELDRIETDLRWAGLLQRRLIAQGLPAAARRIEQNRAGALSGAVVRHDQFRGLMLEVVRRAVERLDSSRGQRLERLVSLAMDRALARVTPAAGSTKASAIARQAQTDGTRPALNPWSAWLELPQTASAQLARLDEASRVLIERRYGVAGSPPMTIDALARDLGSGANQVALRLHRALARLRLEK